MEVLNSVSYDQYSNIPATDEIGIKTKIILSEECYLKLLQMISKTRNSNNETGAFFVGRKSKEDPFTIFIDYCTSEFACTNGNISGGAAEPTNINYNELNQQISVCKSEGETPIVFHFHTHPRQLHYESFSDQDLSLYAKMQLDNPDISAFGMLGFPIPNGNMSNGLTIVQPVRPQKNGEIGCAEFYMYQNIYYCFKNKIHKIGQFDKKYEGRRYNQNLGLGIVRNSKSLTGQRKVCGVGLNPNTGKRIEDEVVGYIDLDGVMCFPNEYVQFTFTDLNSPKYIHGGINKNTYEMLFNDKIVDKSESQGVEQQKAWDTIDEYTMQQQKSIFGNLLKLFNIVNPVDYGKIVYDKKTKEYKYSHNGLEYTFDMISRYFDDPKIGKELLSNDRRGECNKGSIILSDAIKGSRIATGYITVGNRKVLHSVVLFDDPKKGSLVYDWTLNLIMPLNQYKDMVSFNKLSEVASEDIRPELSKLVGFDLDTKTYLMFSKELIEDTKRNEGIFRK